MSNIIKKSVDPSLWWDPFVSLLNELENASLTSCLPSQLEKKVKDSNAWLVRCTTLFEPPNEKSRDALTCEKLEIGSHTLIIEPGLKDKALFISSYLCLDEVQSYIILDRSLKRSDRACDAASDDYLHLALIYYYIERQCLLKCLRQILIHALYAERNSNGVNSIHDEVSKMTSEGLELKLICLFDELLSTRHPEKMDADLYTMWAEEILTECNIVLEILFMIYYNSFCTFNVETWKKLCSMYKGMVSGVCNLRSLEVSSDAKKTFYHTKVQLLMILIEGLNLENLLQLMHDAISFRQGLKFSVDDIQQIDALISSFSITEIKVASPLYMAWATFLSLLSSLPDETFPLLENDHAFYAQQISEYDLFHDLISILDCDLLKQSEVLASGYKSVLRTFVSSFIASYEVGYQSESDSFELMLDVICKIYRGEESLCTQFWDKASYIDSPIRCLLYALEKEFPIKICPLVRLLSALCHGIWPAFCVYTFLENVVGISTLLDISNGPSLDSTSTLIETRQSLRVPGFENLFIPSKTSGRIIKFVNSNNVLVQWELPQSGVTSLLMRLAQFPYINSNEVALILKLLNSMMSSNLAVTFSLLESGNSLNFDHSVANGELDKPYWLVDVTCSVVRKFLHNPQCTILMSYAVLVLSNVMRCLPCAAPSILQKNLFELDLQTNFQAIGSDLRFSWKGSGKLAKMLLIDSEVNCSDYSLTISVLEFTMQLLDTKVDENSVLAFISLALQYIFVDHGSWRYRLRHVRWKVTHKVMEMMKKCVVSIPFYPNLAPAIRHMLLSDSSIHSALFGLICVSKETLENLSVSRVFELIDVEGFHSAICSALAVLDVMITTFYKDISFGDSVFFQLMMSSTTSPVPLTTALISFLTYLDDNEIQVGATRVLSKLFMVAKYSNAYPPSNIILSLNDNKIAAIRHVISHVLLMGLESNENLFYHVVNLLTSAAEYQPAVFLAIASLENGKILSLTGSAEDSLTSNHSNLLNCFIQIIEKFKVLISRNPKVLFVLLRFLSALWEGAAHYASIIEYLKASGDLWQQLSDCIMHISSLEAPTLDSMNEREAENLAFKYKCLSSMVDIVSCEKFLAKKFSRAESLTESRTVKNESRNPASKDYKKFSHDSGKQVISCLFDNSRFLKILHSCATSGYDNKVHDRAQIATSLFVVHILEKIIRGDTGGLSFSFLRIMRETFLKMSSLRPFTELMEHYLQRGYSSGKKLQSLILTDLFHHLQGELEGRNISHGPFKELAQFLAESNLMWPYEVANYEGLKSFEDSQIYDLSHLRSDIGLDLWKHTEWKGSIKVAKTMLNSMQKESYAVYIAKSKLRSLNSLTTLFAINDDEVTNGKIITDTLRLSCIEDLCHCFQTLSLSLPNSSTEIVDFLLAQLQLVLMLVKSFEGCLPPSAAVHVHRASLYGLKLSFDPSFMGVQETKKLLLSLLVITFESMVKPDRSADSAEVSNTLLALLPLLCKSIAKPEYYIFSLTAINYILNRLLEPACWFPILCKHLPWSHIVNNLEDQSPPSSVQVTLKFILTLTSANGGAEKLHEAGLFQSLIVNSGNTKDEEWRLRLAVITSLIESLGDDFLHRDSVANLVSLFFSENSDTISFHLSIPEASSVGCNKKRKNLHSAPFSTSSLSQTEQIFVFICAMSKRQLRISEELKLREKSIHLLSFISRANAKPGEFSRNIYLSCPPLSSEDKKLSFVKAKSGWFAHAPYFCFDHHKPDESYPPTFFSDMVALQIYRIAFLILKFISVEAELAVKRYNEAGFVDLTRVPELPVPEILHGLQDQALAAVGEICDGIDVLNSDSDAHPVVILLIRILEMALYLEFCVLQICGIKSVLGRLEDFTLRAKSLFKALEKHPILSSSVVSLSQIASLINPNREPFF